MFLNPCYYEYADFIRVSTWQHQVTPDRAGDVKTMKSHRQNRTQAEKQVDVRNALLLYEKQTGRAWLSTNQIARQIGMARNGRLKAMLDWMVTCGSLQRREMERPGRWPGYEYALSEQVNRFYNRPRKVAIKKRGQVQTTMELFDYGN